jgi:DNA-binding CsgD family transcriptional regulator
MDAAAGASSFEPDEMNQTRGRVPDWVKRLDAAVWITYPDRRLQYMNSQAEELIGHEASHCVGKLCYQVIAGRDENGARFCGPRCPAFRSNEADESIEPTTINVHTNNGAPCWIRVLYIPLLSSTESGRSLVHCALDMSGPHRLEEYITKVASRTVPLHRRADARIPERLTPRELEILDLLSRDDDPHAIARRHALSYVTVRNHVQHILSKLGVHSTEEAVALYLLEADWSPRN